MPLSKDELPFPKVFSAEYYDRYGRTPWRNPTNRFTGMIQGHQMLRTTCQQEVNKCYGSARLSLAVSQTEGGV